MIKNKSKIGLTALIGFIGTIPLANWMIHSVGTFCVPDGPCMIPVAPGIMAPSGVLVVGLAFVLRDIVQRELGSKFAIAAIFVGAALSGLVASPALVIASIAAFTLSELADFAVYTPLQKRGLVKAVLASSVVGLVIDSAVFLYLAFGSLAYIEGQIIGKLLMVLIALPLIKFYRDKYSNAIFG
jgi:queuosine precursor transporter